MNYLRLRFVFLQCLSVFIFKSYAYDAEVNGIYYILSGETASVTYYSNNYYYNKEAYKGSVIIPKSITYNGSNYSVTSIGEFAFYYCSNMTSIVIPNSIVSIGERAFVNCSGLTSLTIPYSVTSIGDFAFQSCNGLISINVDSENALFDSRNNCNAIIQTSSNCLLAGCKNTTIPNSVTSIGNWAFDGFSSLTSVTIPNSVTSIGYGAFYMCSGLTSVTIPNSVTSISSFAFYGCSGLTSMTIPKNVTYFCESALRGCSGLTSIVVESGNTVYDSRNNCNAVIWTSSNRLIAGCMNTTIPNNVISIGGWAFHGCTGLTSMTVPNSVTTIESGAFQDCM